MNSVMEPERGFLHKAPGTEAALVVLLRRADEVDLLEVINQLAPLGKLGRALATVVLLVARPVHLQREQAHKGQVALGAAVLGLLHPLVGGGDPAVLLGLLGCRGAAALGARRWVYHSGFLERGGGQFWCAVGFHHRVFLLERAAQITIFKRWSQVRVPWKE
jgi:hypothetical protein